jgi:hypothetical protein
MQICNRAAQLALDHAKLSLVANRSCANSKEVAGIFPKKAGVHWVTTTYLSIDGAAVDCPGMEGIACDGQ